MKIKRALTVYESTNMYGGAHKKNVETARKAAQEGRDIVVYAEHYDGERYRYFKYRVTDLRETKDGRIIGRTKHGNIWQATADICQYAKNGKI